LAEQEGNEGMKNAFLPSSGEYMFDWVLTGAGGDITLWG